MRYVYLFESVHDRAQHYVGQTDDLRSRLQVHHSGGSIHTRRFKPWNLVRHVGFADAGRAVAFESYLKTGSGKTFLRRHFL